MQHFKEDTENLIDMETLERVAPVLRIAAHPLRLRILDFLQQAGAPRSVTEIVASTNAPQAVVSQQLRILKDQGVLSARRDGVNILYAVEDVNIFLLLDCIRAHK